MTCNVSIIVPVYNAQKTLGRCVDSILCQTYRDFELILVDDGSKDHSGVICDNYGAKDSRVWVIHQKNQGAAAARNAGMDAAKGEFITFCDSDDMVSPLWLERLISCAGHDTLPVCAHCDAPDQLGQPKSLPVMAEKCMAPDEYWGFNKCGIAGFLGNALYSGRIIQEHQLRLRTQHEKGDYNEDLLFELNYVKHIKKILYTGYSDYLYDTRADSLSNSFPQMYFEKYEEKYYLWKAFLRERPEEQKELATVMLYHFLHALDHCKYSKFKQIVLSDCLQTCVRLGDTSKENPAIIAKIRKKAVRSLWLRYQIHHLKGRFL